MVGFEKIHPESKETGRFPTREESVCKTVGGICQKNHGQENAPSGAAMRTAPHSVKPLAEAKSTLLAGISEG